MEIEDELTLYVEMQLSQEQHKVAMDHTKAVGTVIRDCQAHLIDHDPDRYAATIMRAANDGRKEVTAIKRELMRWQPAPAEQTAPPVAVPVAGGQLLPDPRLQGRTEERAVEVDR
jgi:hypothetical protein